jgi:hypothetical protein
LGFEEGIGAEWPGEPEVEIQVPAEVAIEVEKDEGGE